MLKPSDVASKTSVLDSGQLVLVARARTPRDAGE